MSKKHPLQGLIKWAQGGQWREAFEETILQHFGSACDEMDVELDDLDDLLDPIDFMKAWNCALEDLVSKDIDGENLTDDYLKRRGWKETAGSRAHMRSLRESVPSLYEISGVRLEEGFFLRDLIRGGEPFWVHEKPRTRSLRMAIALPCAWLRSTAASSWGVLCCRLTRLTGRNLPPTSSKC